MDNIKEIYITTTNAINEVIDEKQTFLEEMFYFIFAFFIKFNSSPYIYELISTIYNYYIEIIKEADMEHEVYDKLKEYMRDLSNEGIKLFSQDEKLLEELMDMFDSIEETVECRILKHSRVYKIFNNLLEQQTLNNRIYKLIKYEETMTEEDKKAYLSLIPRR